MQLFVTKIAKCMACYTQWDLWHHHIVRQDFFFFSFFLSTRLIFRKPFSFISYVHLGCPIPVANDPNKIVIPTKRTPEKFVQRLSYITEDNIPKEGHPSFPPFVGNGSLSSPLFGGHQTWQQRDESFKIKPTMQVIRYSFVHGLCVFSWRYSRNIVSNCWINFYDQYIWSIDLFYVCFLMHAFCFNASCRTTAETTEHSYDSVNSFCCLALFWKYGFKERNLGGRLVQHSSVGMVMRMNIG